MSNKSPWAGPRLLVPITIDALVITRKRDTTPYSIHALNLKDKYRDFEPLSTPLFTPVLKGKEPDPGIYINWSLPDGMTKGTINAQGKAEYPYLPNRWMITRFSADPGVERQSWIVKSDELYNAEKPGKKVHPQFIKNNNGQPEIKYIGHAYDLADYNEEKEGEELILTAIGNSDPLFTAYSGNNMFVYSFTDKILDPDALNLSYMVTGWFSNSEYDILYPAPKTSKPWTNRKTWIETMNRLQWAAGTQAGEGDYDLKMAAEAGQKYLAEQKITPFEGDKGKYASQTLCHGLVFDVKWPGLNVLSKNVVPKIDTATGWVPYVAAGNSATDCISAFMQWQINYNKKIVGATFNENDIQVEKMLEAFSHKMLIQPGGVYDTPELDNVIRESWFGKMPGGFIWVAQAPPKAGELNPEDGNKDSLAQLPNDRALELAALNNLQYVYDEKSRELVTLQRQLYADWLKANIYSHSQMPPPLPKDCNVDEVLRKSAKAVKDLMDTMPAAKRAIEDARIALNAKLGKEFTLKDKPANDFYKPGDPVVLINNAKRSFKRGEDIIYSEYDDFLFTRFSGQFITCIEVKLNLGGESKIVYAKDVFAKLPANTNVPSEVYYLMDEAYLLNPGFAAAIAKAVVPVQPSEYFIKRIKSQQTLIWNKGPKTPIDQRSLEELAGFNPNDPYFRIPSKIAVWAWTQPWTPLYLEWRVGFIPVVDETLSKWQFDGNDFKWKQDVPLPEPKPNDLQFQGRSLLTPKEAITMQARLREFLDEFQGNIPSTFVPLNDILQNARNWDVLSQTLTGFSMQMMQWDIEQFGRQPLEKEYADGVGNEAHGWVLDGYPTNFFPLRAGFVTLKKLWIVDDFGQVCDLTPGSEKSSHGIKPIPAIGVRPDKYQISSNLPPYFQLPPRLVQGARLNLNFLSAVNDAVLSSQSADTTPVCGWLLPNHLNHSVMAYDKAGKLLGEIMPMGATGRQHAQWIPAPIKGCHTADIDNKHLQKFVLGLLGVASGDQGTPESGKALKNFMQVIDETLWAVDPMGERNNQSLSILVGRPIAVVRASIDLELYGKPGTNLAWMQTGLNNDGGVKRYKFPVQIGSLDLGQDGVMGYFANNDYKVFNSVHNGQVKDVANPPYVTNTFSELKADGEPVYLTMLLDPRGAIHCSTGILPVLKTELPEVYVGKVLDDMLIEFKAGPIIVDKKQWWMPLPAGVGQSWSWLEPGLKDGQPNWNEVSTLVPANAVPQFTGHPQTIVEGRLRLTGVLGGDLLILSFEVLNEKTPYRIKAGSTIKLSWSSQGGATAQLKFGSESAVDVPTNQASMDYTVTKTIDITLTLSDGKLGTRGQTINITAL
ncbi:hypothetical protein IDJ77_00755 [Mucilaginibacter sp. ZT4R22]|uniref:Uncharacterized protein n=1 Tax=Mucilaginibacter pankratovii TaxID=2772110 RepID=A0ABR7WJ23_9SPHI|nr:hypothetical protein [Mucilaginibacter pankratovii]MBD1362324.1 hypothetical protein [Mucilaginibacter pankratovii]